MKFHVPPANQGQIVEVAYGQTDGIVYRRTTDRSDGSVSYECATADDNDEGDYWNGEPADVDSDWTECSQPE